MPPCRGADGDEAHGRRGHVFSLKSIQAIGPVLHHLKITALEMGTPRF